MLLPGKIINRALTELGKKIVSDTLEGKISNTAFEKSRAEVLDGKGLQ